MDIIPLEKRCEFCLRNEATLLCDVTRMKYAGHPPKGESSLFMTCDNRMCKECATNFYYMDFCPKCSKELKKILEEKYERIKI